MAKSTNRYGLADYKLVVSFPAEAGFTSAIAGESAQLEIGGPGQNGYEGSYLGSIKVSRKNDLWDTDDDPTGSWVHNKNLGRSGTVDLEVSQVSDQIVTLSYLCMAYESVQESIDGLTLEVKNVMSGVVVAKCYDCLIKKIPDQNFAGTAEKQTWTFTCGRIMFYA